MAEELKKKYQAGVVSVNCEQLRKEDVSRIMEKLLYEFPIVQMEFYVPKWVEMLPADPLFKGKSSWVYSRTYESYEVM